MTDITKILIPKPQKMEDKKELVKVAAFNKFSCDVVLYAQSDLAIEAKNLILSGFLQSIMKEGE